MFRKLAYSILALVFAASMAQADPIITGAIPNTFTPGSTISSSQMNANFQYIINQANANAAKNGVNSSITALTALTTPLAPAQGGSAIFAGGISTGTANAQVVASAIPTGFTLTYGNTIRFIPGFTNTGATTLAVNGLAATNVFRQTPFGVQALTGGEIQASQEVEAFFDGIQFELVNNSAEFGGYGPGTSIASGATVDIGTIASHNVSISSPAASITSFGSSASTTYPFYFVQFADTHTLINSASLVLLNGATKVVTAFDRELFIYGGAGVWYEIAVYPAVPKAGVGSASQLYIRNNGGTPNSKIDVSATETIMDTSTGGAAYVENYGSCTIDLTVTGANGLDTGAVAANTWYYIYLLKGGTFVACLASTSATAPVLPASTPYKLRVGAIRTDSAAATLWKFTQRGNRMMLTTTTTAGDMIVASGIVGTCPGTLGATLAAYGVVAPTTAASLLLQLNALNASTCIAPSDAVTPFVSESCAFSSSATYTTKQQTVLNNNGVTTLLYCGSAVASAVEIAGWIDSVNAN